MKSNIDQRYLYSEITGGIIGCALRLHTSLGNGYPEVIYQRGMAYEMNKTGLEFGREVEMPVYYDEVQIGTRRADFIVINKVLLELKAVGEINNSHFNQVQNYLKAYKLEVGLLINFGENSLKWKRFIMTNESVQSKKSAIKNTKKYT
jgi:GxxExxY protein